VKVHTLDRIDALVQRAFRARLAYAKLTADNGRSAEAEVVSV